MDGALALLFGLVLAGIIYATPTAWLKAGGGALVILTILFLLRDVALSLFR